MTCFPTVTTERQRNSQNKQMLPLAFTESTLQRNDGVIAEKADERESPMGTTMSEIKSNLSQQSEKVCFRAKNTGISLPLMLKDVFFP